MSLTVLDSWTKLIRKEKRKKTLFPLLAKKISNRRHNKKGQKAPKRCPQLATAVVATIHTNLKPFNWLQNFIKIALLNHPECSRAPNYDKDVSLPSPIQEASFWNWISDTSITWKTTVKSTINTLMNGRKVTNLSSTLWWRKKRRNLCWFSIRWSPWFFPQDSLMQHFIPAYSYKNTWSNASFTQKINWLLYCMRNIIYLVLLYLKNARNYCIFLHFDNKWFDLLTHIVFLYYLFKLH